MSTFGKKRQREHSFEYDRIMQEKELQKTNRKHEEEKKKHENINNTSRKMVTFEEISNLHTVTSKSCSCFINSKNTFHQEVNIEKKTTVLKIILPITASLKII